MNEQHNPWQIIGDKDKYENPWIKVVEYQVINPGGGKGIYGKVHFKNIAVGIIPLDEKNNTWLIGQYRFPIETYSWEIPEGGGDLKTDPLISAQRELLEEAGIKAKKWDKILDMHISNSVTNETCVVYLARDLSFHETQPEESEQLSIKKISFDMAFDMAMNGKITDAISVAAILKAHYLINNQLL